MSPLELALYNILLSIHSSYLKNKRVSSLIMSTTPVVKRALPPYYSGLACVQAPHPKRRERPRSFGSAGGSREPSEAKRGNAAESRALNHHRLPGTDTGVGVAAIFVLARRLVSALSERGCWTWGLMERACRMPPTNVVVFCFVFVPPM